MKKILAMLCICFISVLCLCSCNKQEVNNTQITYIEAEPEFPELKNAIINIQPIVESKLINFLNNDTEYIKIKNLYDLIIISDYTIYSPSHFGSQCFILTVDMDVLYKVPDKLCWMHRWINATTTDYSANWSYRINLNNHLEINKLDELVFSKNKYVIKENEDGFNENGNLYLSTTSYKASYGFTKMTKKDIISDFNKNPHYYWEGNYGDGYYGSKTYLVNI